MAKSRFTPQYQLIYESLRDDILSGAYAPGSRLPFERELCEIHGVQRITVRKALELLVQDGLIFKQPGKGSFVQGAGSAPRRPSASLLFAMDKSRAARINASSHDMQLFFQMEQLCLAQGCSLLCAGASDAHELAALVERHAVDGVFLSGSMPDGCAELLADRGIPAVCVNHVRCDALCVLADNHDGMRKAVSHLFRLGHRRIAFLGATDSAGSQERQQGFLAACCEFNLPVTPELALICDGSYEGSCAAVSAALSAHPAQQPTALVAADDVMAIAAMETAVRAGLSVPEHLSVIGFGNADLCRICSPQLTSIGPSLRQLASVAVEHLIPLLHRATSPDDCYALRVPVTLTQRGSVAAPALLPLTALR